MSKTIDLYLSNISNANQKAATLIGTTKCDTKYLGDLISLIDSFNYILKNKYVPHYLNIPMNKDGKIEVVFASTNTGKITEVQSFFNTNPVGRVLREVMVITTPSNLTDCEEKTTSFNENAAIKALNYSKEEFTAKLVLTDDSGLILHDIGYLIDSIRSIGGLNAAAQEILDFGNGVDGVTLLPGVISARFSSKENLDKLSTIFAEREFTDYRAKGYEKDVANSLLLLDIIDFLQTTVNDEFDENYVYNASVVTSMHLGLNGKSVCNAMGFSHGEVRHTPFSHLPSEDVLRTSHGFNQIFYITGLGEFYGELSHTQRSTFDHRSTALKNLFTNLFRGIAC